MKLTPEQKALITYVNAVQGWKKRAAFRAWIPIFKRDCENCRYYLRTKVPVRCIRCLGSFNGLSKYWGPKEEKI